MRIVSGPVVALLAQKDIIHHNPDAILIDLLIVMRKPDEGIEVEVPKLETMDLQKERCSRYCRDILGDAEVVDGSREAVG